MTVGGNRSHAAGAVLRAGDAEPASRWRAPTRCPRPQLDRFFFKLQRRLPRRARSWRRSSTAPPARPCRRATAVARRRATSCAMQALARQVPIAEPRHGLRRRGWCWRRTRTAQWRRASTRRVRALRRQPARRAGDRAGGQDRAPCSTGGYNVAFDDIRRGRAAGPAPPADPELRGRSRGRHRRRGHRPGRDERVRPEEAETVR